MPPDLLESAAVLQRVDRRALRRLLEAQRLRGDYAAYMRWAWPVLYPHKPPLQWNWHLDAFADHLMACKRGQIKRLIINVHPRSLKSFSISVGFPTWWWTDNPATQFICASANEKIVGRDADAMRQLCASPEYQEMFRPRWDFRAPATGKRQDAQGYYRNSVGGHRVSNTVGAQGAGMDADVVIIDDPLDPSNAFSDKAALGQHTQDCKQRLFTRLNDPETGVIIVIMQRLHELDLTGVLLEEGGWEHLDLPAEYDGRTCVTVLGTPDPRTEDGELFFPERFSQEHYNERRVDLTARGFAGQFQQLPAPAGGAMVKKTWLQYWTPDTLPKMGCTIGSWDPPKREKKSKDSDPVGGEVWGFANGNAYLLDGLNRPLDIIEMIEAIREQHRLWPGLMATVIEEKAAGKHVMTTLETELPGIEGFNPQAQSKQERLAAVLPMFEQGKVFLPHAQLCSTMERDYSWVLDYVRELLTFPGGRNDAQVDCTSQALIWKQANIPDEIYVKAIG